jgi:hypothetical protein
MYERRMWVACMRCVQVAERGCCLRSRWDDADRRQSSLRSGLRCFGSVAQRVSTAVSQSASSYASSADLHGHHHTQTQQQQQHIEERQGSFREQAGGDRS